jgi:hypothetical protein
LLLARHRLLEAARLESLLSGQPATSLHQISHVISWIFSRDFPHHMLTICANANYPCM